MKYSHTIIAIFSYLIVACGGGGESNKARTSSLSSSIVLNSSLSSISHSNISSLSSSAETTSSSTSSINNFPEVPIKNITPSLTSEAAALDIALTIEKLESPIATAGLGQTLSIIDNDGENIIFATNSKGEVIFIGSDLHGISIETTAKYLAYIGLLASDNPAELPSNDVRPFLEEASTYSELVANVKSELEKGIPLSKSDVIGEHISNVVLEAQNTYAQLLSNELLSVSAKVTKPYNIPKLDYYIIDEAADEKFWIANGDQQSVTVNNRTFLYWSARSTDLANGASLSESTIIPPLKTTTAQLVAFYAGSESKTNIPTRLRTELTIGQSQEAINANSVLLVTRSTFAIIDLAFAALKISPPNAQTCVINAANILTTNPSFARFVTNPSASGFREIFESIDSLEVLQLVPECANATAVTNNSWYKSINEILIPFRAARSGNSAFGTLYQLIKYSNKNYSFELCRYAQLIGPCVRRLTGSSEIIELEIDETETLHINAFDDDNILIPTPSLNISSSDNSVATVDPVNSLGKIMMKGVSAGSANLIATDPVTGVKLEKPVSIVVKACTENGNKLLRRTGTTSTPIYVGKVANVTDGLTDTNVNFSTSSGELTIELGQQQCFSKFEIVYAVSPSSNVNFLMKFLDSFGQEIRSESVSAGNILGDTLTVTSITLTKPVYGVASVQVLASNSVSWVSLYEIRGF